MHKGLKWEREAAVRVMLAGHADELPMSWMQSVRGGVGQGDCGLGLQLLGAGSVSRGEEDPVGGDQELSLVSSGQ